MLQRSIVSCCFALACCLGTIVADDEVSAEIRILAPGVSLKLVTQNPQVATPTGIDVDSDGNVWVVSSHTHFRPDDYDGPEYDEVVVISPSGTRRVFDDQGSATMDLELGSDGWVYLAQRDQILRIRDTDGDGKADQREMIAVLETEADYPHNGLSGLAWHPDGDLVFALGENYAKRWTLRSVIDQTELTGSGEGGIFRCGADGSGLERIARGFWNPFGICVRTDGSMFAAENDPGSRPPCRLLHLVPGGDYGYQRSYGNSPVHPFVCWNGELPGTLPMLHSLREAPCGIAPLGKGLVVTSWTDHTLDYYPLQPAGASFQTKRVELVSGGLNFRPTCIAQSSDTVFYIADWVIGSYAIHRRGRVWRLEIDPKAARDWLGDTFINKPTPEAVLANRLRSGDPEFTNDRLLMHAGSNDPFLARAAIDGLAKRASDWKPNVTDSRSPAASVALLLAVRKAMPKATDWASHFLELPDSSVRVEALRWIADETLAPLKDSVRSLMTSTNDYRVFEACLATHNALAGQPEKGVVDMPTLLQTLRDPASSTSVKAFALRLVAPTSKALNAKLVSELAQSDDEQIRSELVRTLVAIGDAEFASKWLYSIASDSTLPSTLRADAIAGLPNLSQQDRTRLLELASSENTVIQQEALRSLRFTKVSEQERNKLSVIAGQTPQLEELISGAMDTNAMVSNHPPKTETDRWLESISNLPGSGNVANGRRLFFHPRIAACWKCHRHSGRGNVVGPDLTRIARGPNAQRKLLVSLLEPSAQVDPQYHPRMLVMDDGKTFTGILLRDGGGGSEVYRDSTGQERRFQTADIAKRKELDTSVMPEGLLDSMSLSEIRDLMTFLLADDDHVIAKKEIDAFLGDWWLEFEDGYGGWFSLSKNQQGELSGQLLWRVGSPRNISKVELVDGSLRFLLPGKKRGGQRIAQLEGNRLTIRVPNQNPAPENQASGARCPPMPAAPDLTTVQFGDPIDLFNGRNLDGWKLHPAEAVNGWSAKNGELVNETPKTDFSAYGSFGNLRTERVFGDCRLHVEFNVESKRNSGVYVRGLYEAQVVDRDSPMQGIAGVGAVFGRVKPTKNAGKPGGQWQSYDITLVDRHITVVLNGETVIDNQPVLGCTGGSLIGNVSRDGPLYLQGDHTSVRYRNLRIWPRIKSETHE